MPTLLDLVQDPVSIAVFALFFALFAWEALFPARKLPHVPGWQLRGLVAFVAYFLVSSYLPFLLAEWFAPLRLFDASALSTLEGAALAVLAYEVLSYAWHRTLHGSTFMWRVFHQMHHSSERIDVPSAFWFSPLDMAGWTVVSTLTLTFVGLSPTATFAFVMITSFFGIFQHANIRTPTWLGYIMQRPENHAHHHARGVHEGNYADLSFIDMAFGTFRNPRNFPERTGLVDGASARVVEMLTFQDVSNSKVNEERTVLA